MGSLEEKISLYADDAVLYLQDAESSLKATLAFFNELGQYSRFCINWDKFTLFPLDSQAHTTAPDTSLVWVKQFRYLGIQVRRDPASFSELNVIPLLSQLHERCVLLCL